MAIVTTVWHFLTSNAAPGPTWPPVTKPRLTLVPRHPALEMRLQGDTWIPRSG